LLSTHPSWGETLNVPHVSTAEKVDMRQLRALSSLAIPKNGQCQEAAAGKEEAEEDEEVVAQLVAEEKGQ